METTPEFRNGIRSMIEATGQAVEGKPEVTDREAETYLAGWRAALEEVRRWSDWEDERVRQRSLTAHEVVRDFDVKIEALLERGPERQGEDGA